MKKRGEIMAIIEVKNLVKNYANLNAVNDISFMVEKGSLFAFLGENGAGKSTTINILCQVLTKTSGDIYIDGIELTGDNLQIKNLIGIVFQNTILDDNLTIKENILTRAALYGLSKKEAKTRLNYLIAKLELGEIINRRYNKLSGGQRRRADIARALIHQPKILFLDEPTTGLDPKTRQMVWQILDDLRKEEQLTIFLTTHYMEETLTADEVVILDHGKIVATGTPASLKEKYTTNKLIWYTPKSDTTSKLLKIEGIPYYYHVDAYYLSLKNNSEIINFITKYKEILTSFELLKGSMDDVFLAVTGRKLGDKYES